MINTDFMPIEKYYALKSIFERIWGKDTYLQLKHCSNLKVWKKYAERTLSASKLACQETVAIKDDDWQNGINDIVDHGIQLIQLATSFDDLFESLAASYIELSFHQIGLMPNRPSDFRAQLRSDNWKLDQYRTVQYIQNSEQKQAVKGRIERNIKAKGKVA